MIQQLNGILVCLSDASLEAVIINIRSERDIRKI